VGVVLVVNAVPLVYLVSAAGLAIRAEPDLERAARLSGAGPWTALRTVTLPLLRPALAAAAVLTFVATLESFAVPQVLGAPAGFSTVTTRIYSGLSLGGDPASFAEAVTLALVLVLLAAVVITPADLVLGPRLRVRRTGQQAGAAVVRRQTAGGRAVATVLWVYLGFAVAIPTVALLAAALTRAVGLPPTPANWTLDNFAAVVDRSMLAADAKVAVLTEQPATAGAQLLVRPDWIAMGGPLPGVVLASWFRGPHTDHLLDTPAGEVLVREPGQERHSNGTRLSWDLHRVWPVEG
jgi:iron(III) transport system permease protein